ncbi:MAG: DUF3783 domain-containing protein [Lachnospiraceae bacterium]|nr:DUF3783 domain-containing protein [Lachnospiraceae bacterium]
MNKKIVLVYAMEAGKRKLLKRALAPLGISVQEVLQSQYALSVGELALGKNPGGASLSSMPQGSGAALGSRAIGEMTVFSGVTPDEMDRVIDALKEAGLQIPLKATVTMYNVSWTGYALFQELSREHQEMQK